MAAAGHVDLMMATVCRCFGSCIPDSRERRKLSSQAGVAVISTLVGLLHVHFGGQKSHDDIERLLQLLVA